MEAPEIEGYTYIGTSVKRFVARTDGINSREELVKFLKQAMPQELFNQLTPNDIDKYYKEFEHESNIKNPMLEFMNPIYDRLKKENTANSNKKAGELVSLARLMQALNKLEEIKLIGEAEPPDFIVEYKGELIGVEITGKYNQEVVAEINGAKELLKKCEVKLNAETSTKGSIHLKIIPSKLKYSKAQSENIVTEICNYIIAIEQKTKLPELDYIEFVFKEETANLTLVLYEDYSLTQVLTAEAVNQIVLSKEEDIPKYKNDQKIQRYWLLILIEGASEKSSFDYSQISNLTLNTKFDNVFIIEFFKARLIYSKYPL